MGRRYHARRWCDTCDTWTQQGCEVLGQTTIPTSDGDVSARVLSVWRCAVHGGEVWD